jgi:hypothetical protein
VGQRLVVVQARQLAVGQPEPLDAGSLSSYAPEGVEQRVGSAPPRPHRAREARDQLTRRQVVDRLPERQDGGRVQDSERLAYISGSRCPSATWTRRLLATPA